MMFAQSTIYLKTLLDNPETKVLIDKALSTYPVYTPKNSPLYTVIPTREEINTKLLNFYKYREIGFETIGRFLDELEISMNEIMPYYNQIMKSEDMINEIEDVFSNVDFTEQYDEQTRSKSEGNSEVESSGDTQTTTSNTSETNSETSSELNNSATSETTNSSKHVKSDTPQNNLSVTAQNIDTVSYASEVDWEKDQANGQGTVHETNNVENNVNVTENGTTTSQSSQTSTGSNVTEAEGTTTHTMTKKGNQGVNTYAHDMLEFRHLFQNIVQQIINDERISELFMLVY